MQAGVSVCLAVRSCKDRNTVLVKTLLFVLCKDTDDTHFKMTKVFDLLENSETLVTILKTILIKNDYYHKQR